uniref:Alfy-like armadillo-like repeat domain-containing protein n=1 Tax=Megaselia scalaris TaxID=36166 RepID=T1GN58_MEGSC
MQRLQIEANPLEVVEMFVSVFCFLKDSSEVSQVLLDDFRSSQGYLFLTEFLLKLENEKTRTIEVQAAIRNLVLMISSLCMCGYTELRPSHPQSNAVFKMQNFQMPQNTSRETGVRNIYAFQVLQSVFLKSSSTGLCCTILDAISSVYHSDNANYFILDSENTLSQFTEKIHLKSPQIQEKFFDLLEFIVFQLNFVPCKELISLSILLKSNLSPSCSILCLKTLLNILRHNNLFKDVYREVGILEVFVSCLMKYSEYVKYITNNDENAEVQFGKTSLEALTILLNGNNNNANVFRESGGAKCAHDLVTFKQCRSQSLGIIRELILSAGGDDDMLFILSIMHAVPANHVDFKIQILNMLLGCLKDSHRTRTVFRKVGGFVYLTSVFVSLDGKLNDSENGDITQHDLILLLQIVCQTLGTAMRFEPANAKFFHQEICTASLCETLRLLGCFGTNLEITNTCENFENNIEYQKYFHEVFSEDILSTTFSSSIPKSLSYVCVIYRLLYSIALDNFENPNLNNYLSIFADQQLRSPSQDYPTLTFGQPSSEPRIVHPGVVICMLQLLPSISHHVEVHKAINLQVYLADILKSLVRNERNQQIMCEFEQAALPIVPLLQSHVQYIAPNVFYFTTRVVDKLWQGHLTKNPHDIFDFIIKLIAQAKRRSSALSLEQLHHSLNRTILYLLSRPTETITEQMSVLEALHKIITNRLLVFGAGNHELEFIGCLTYCLMQLTADMKIILEPSTTRNTTWHVNPQRESIEERDDQLNQLQGKNLIVGAAFRVWEELYVCKKPAIEEVFKVSLTSPSNNSKAPDINSTREQVMELASKLWFNYVDAERKALYRVPLELHNQIQSKIQKVTGGLTRLASRTKVKKDELIRTKSTMSKDTVFESTQIHVQLIRDLWEMRCKQYLQMHQHTQRYVFQDWLQSELSLPEKEVSGVRRKQIL